MELPSKLQLARGVSMPSLEEIGCSSILGREGFDSNRVIVLHEGSATILKAVISGQDAPIVTIQQIEGLDDEVEFEPVLGQQAASDS
jgi:hypothetical protein